MKPKATMRSGFLTNTEEARNSGTREPDGQLLQALFQDSTSISFTGERFARPLPEAFLPALPLTFYLSL